MHAVSFRCQKWDSDHRGSTVNGWRGKGGGFSRGTAANVGEKIEPAVDGRGLGPGGGCFINMRNWGDD